MSKLKKGMLALSLLSATAYGDVNSDLNNYFNRIGFSSNVTNPAVVQGQEAGYLSGGSLYLRNPVKDVQLAQISLPSISAGCGGINMFGGSFSFMNSAELVQTAKALMQNAVGVGFQIAMQEFSPTISNILSDARSWMNEINQMDMNSCTAAYAIAGLVTKDHEANKYACNDLNTQGGEFADWASSAEGCQDDSQQANQNANNTPEGKVTMLVSKNLVWAALQEDSSISTDDRLMQFLMSITGTITFDANGVPTYYESLAKNDALINLLLNGSQNGSNTAQYYVCDTTDQCLKPTPQSLPFTNQGLVTSVANDISDIKMRLDSDQPLTAQDQSFLSSVPWPMLSYMQIAEEGHIEVDFSQFAQAIADEILIHYLSASAEQVRAELVEKTNFPADSMQQIYANIDAVVQQLNDKYARDSQSMAQMFNILQNMLVINQSAVGELSSKTQNNLEFGVQ